MSLDERVPLLIVTGFVGSGRTTLIARWLAEPALADSAVLANELGAVGFDHHLVGAVPGAARVVAGGCACCSARRELAAALAELVSERARRPSARFERVIVELNGLADPVPLLEDLAYDDALRERLSVQGVVAAVDAVEGARVLASQREARLQAAVADALVITRSELVPAAAVDALAAMLAALNPEASILASRGGSSEGVAAWRAAGAAPGRERRRIGAALDAGPIHESVRDAGTALAQVHGDAVAVRTLRFDAPVELSGFCVRLAAFLEDHAPRVLRVKGLVAVEGRRGPAVMQSAGRTLQPVRTLKEWPAGAIESALVVVTRGVDARSLAALSPAVGAVPDAA